MVEGVEKVKGIEQEVLETQVVWEVVGYMEEK